MGLGAGRLGPILSQICAMPRSDVSPFIRSRFPWLLAALLLVLSLIFGLATAALLFMGAFEKAGLFGLFLAIAVIGALWAVARETLTLDANSGEASLYRRSLLRRRFQSWPLAMVSGFGVESKRVRSRRNTSDEVQYEDIDRPVLFISDGSRHVIFKAHRGGEGARSLASEANAWLQTWRAENSSK